jgi:hypothetical protein
MSEFFDTTKLELRYEPFPIGRVAPMADAATYADMVAHFPALGLFEYLPRLGNKYSLSETCHPAQYRAFVRETPVWARFDRWIHGPDFIPEVMETLLARHIDLGYRAGISRARQTYKNIMGVLRGRRSHRGARFKAVWEFQVMPGQGGHILPHTDAPSKVVTLTLAMLKDGEWDPAWGGGIDVNRARDSRFAYNQLNRQASFDDMEVVDTIDFAPNTGVVFIKTFNSWHSVRPMRAPGQENMRKNIIINITSD